MQGIHELCDWIILAGAVVLAVTNIYKFIKKPADKLMEKNRREFDKLVNRAFDEKIPKMLEENNKKIKVELFEDIKNAILEVLQPDFEELRNMNNEQNENIKILSNASKDVLRQRIMVIYHTYRKDKALPLFEKEALDELYKDYKTEHGNSYIDKYYKRMTTWKVLDDEGEAPID